MRVENVVIYQPASTVASKPCHTSGWYFYCVARLPCWCWT